MKNKGTGFVSLLENYKKNLKKIWQNKLKRDPKAFWIYAYSKLKTRSKIAQLINKDGSLTQTSEQQTQVLNNVLSSVFTNEDLHQIPTLQERHQNELMAHIHITTDMIL